MSAYAMFLGESLPIILEFRPTHTTINNEMKQFPNDSENSTHGNSHSPKLNLIPPETQPLMASTTVSLCSESNPKCQQITKQRQGAGVQNEKCSCSIESNKSNLGIAVTSANLDRKRFIALNNSSSRSGLSSIAIDEWEAVEYELSISLNGKQYTAKRSFPRIVRLRNELVKEVRTRRNNYPGHFPLIRSLITSPVDSKECAIDAEENSKDSDGSLIPELPPGLNDGNERQLLGPARRSLNNIQSSVTGFCPRLEEWLKSVSQLVNPQTSPSLTSFLAEPYPDEQGKMPKIFPRARRFLRRKSSLSSSTLSSISEDNVLDETSITENQNEEDNDELFSESQEILEDDDSDDSFSECDAFDDW